MAELIDELLVRLGLEADAKGFREANSLFSGIRGTALATGAALGGSLAGMAKISDGVAKSRDSLAKWADAANVSTQRAQQLAYALKQVGGSEADAMAMLDNVNHLRDQAMKGELSAWAFEGMEFDVSAIGSMGAEEALDYLMRGISGIADPDRQRRVAGELGFSDPAALGVVTNADRTFSDYRRAGELGGIADQDLFDKSAAYTGALTELEQAAQGLKDIVAGQLLPGMTELVEGITGFIVENKGDFAEFLKAAMPYLQATATGIGALVAAQVGAKGVKWMAANAPAAAVAGLFAFYSEEENREKAYSSAQSSINHLVRKLKRVAGIEDDDPSQALPERPEGWVNEDVPWWPENGASGVGAAPPSGEISPQRTDNYGSPGSESAYRPEAYGPSNGEVSPQRTDNYGPPGGEAIAGISTNTTTITVPITVDARGASDPAAVEVAARRAVEASQEGLIKIARQEFPGNRD